MSIADLIGPDGVVRILAVDHRDSMRYFVAPDDPSSVTDAHVIAIKSDLVRAVAPFATGVMLEPEFSIPQLLDNGALADGTPFTAALEAQGYLADPGAAPTTLLPGWSPVLAKQSGAAAAKLLLPFHPDRPLAAAQIEVAHRVIEECRTAEIDLILEPLFYDLAPSDDRTDIVARTAEVFAATGASLLKLPFPIDPDAPHDPQCWRQACETITERCQQPWALLSAGCTFEVFERQVAAALQGGAVGYMVGRALWGEAAVASPTNRPVVIADLVVPRWHQLGELSG